MKQGLLILAALGALFAASTLVLGIAAYHLSGAPSAADVPALDPKVGEAAAKAADAAGYDSVLDTTGQFGDELDELGGAK